MSMSTRVRKGGQRSLGTSSSGFDPHIPYRTFLARVALRHAHRKSVMTGQSRCCTAKLLDRFPFFPANRTEPAVDQGEKLQGLLHLIWVAAQHVSLGLEG